MNKDKSSNNDTKMYIREKVLNLLELNDLVYHANVIEALIEKIKNQPKESQIQSLNESMVENSEDQENLNNSVVNES